MKPALEKTLGIAAVSTAFAVAAIWAFLVARNIITWLVAP